MRISRENHDEMTSAAEAEYPEECCGLLFRGPEGLEVVSMPNLQNQLHKEDPETYERFEKVILVHGVRYVNEVAYREFITEHLPQNEFFGEALKEKLVYYPTVTREPFENQGRLTDLMRSGKLFADIGLPPINPEDDRAMICGSPSMLAETSEVLDSFGLKASPRMGDPGHYLIERAFVEK